MISVESEVSATAGIHSAAVTFAYTEEIKSTVHTLHSKERCLWVSLYSEVPKHAMFKPVCK